ncbi:MAG: Methyltransferase type 11 [Solirubrobacterales bacterium]|nr:Methyltransferase type 11 [Solirubrobacterales bacterium]
MLVHHQLQQLLEIAKPRTLLAAAATVRQAVAGAAPDRGRALEHYGAMAGSYELRTVSGDQWRRQLVLNLAPRPGEVILDVGCGTGRNFEPIQQRIGPGGRLIGIEQSPEMLERAHALVQRRGWTNVELVCASAEEAAIPATADAALLCGVHDVMRSPAALANVLQHVREGGRIVAGGAKWVPWRRSGAVSLNLSTWKLNRECVSTFEGFQRPWSRLNALLPGLHVEEMYFGGGYIASATRSSGATRSGVWRTR